MSYVKAETIDPQAPIVAESVADGNPFAKGAKLTTASRVRCRRCRERQLLIVVLALFVPFVLLPVVLICFLCHRCDASCSCQCGHCRLGL